MAPPWPMMRFGKMEGGGTLSPSEQKQADGTFEDYKKLQELLDMTEGFLSLPNASMQSTFDDAIRHTGHNISSIFFNTISRPCFFGGVEFTNRCNELATYLVTRSISRVSSHNYNKSVHGYEAKSRWTDMIYGSTGVEMGRSLLAQNLIDNYGFQFYLDDKQKWVSMLEDLFQQEVYIIGTIVNQLSANANLPGKMKFFLLQALGSSKIDAIADKWIQCSSETLIQPAIDFVKTDNHLQFISAWLEDDPYFPEVQAACNEHLVDSSGDYNHHYWGYYVYHWLLSEWNGPKKYNLFVDVDVIDFHQSEYVGGCFLPGTMVLCEKCKEAPIEELEEDDIIIGRAGQTGVNSSETCGVTLKTDTPAFGFNDDEPFFLSSHPFWCQDGWRAMHPKAAEGENPWLEVGQLMQGDYVCKVKNIRGREVEYEWVKVRKINMKMYPAGTRFHGIHTREGPRSYHANGYLVMQNYPEITVQRVVDNVSKLDKKTQQKVQDHLKRLKPTLEKALGHEPAEAIASLAEKKVFEKLKRPIKDVKNPVHSKDFTLPPLEMKYETKNLSYGSYTLPSSVVIHRRQLFVDRKLVEEKFISDDKEVTWCRRVEDALWEHGCITLYGHGFFGEGFIAVTKKKNDTDAVLYAKLKATFKVNIYNCDKSKEEVQPPEDRSGYLVKGSLTWEPCGSFEMGLKFDPVMNIWAAVDIGYLGGRDPVNGHIKLDTNAEGTLIVDINIPPLAAEYALHVKMYGEFNPFYSAFEGYCTEYDESAADFCGKSYGWRGTFDRYEEYEEDMIELARKALLKDQMHSKENIGLTHRYQRKSAKSGRRYAITEMVQVLQRQRNVNLSLDDLFLLTQPDSTELHNRTFALFEKCMKHEMADEDIEAVLGDAKPVLTGEEQAIATAHSEFIGKRFGHCYLMNSLSTLESFEERITETQRNQMLYFLNGHSEEDNNMSRDKDYQSANNDLGRLAFISLCTRIQDYIADDGPGWAQQLYDYITTPDKLLEFALVSDIDQDNSKIQKQAMVLYCLDPNKDLGQDFYTKVMVTKVQNNEEYFNGSSEGEVEMIDIIGDIIALLVEIIQSGDHPELINNIKEQCQQELKELGDEWKEYQGDLISGINWFITTLISSAGYDGSYWNRYFDVGKQIIDKIQPKIAGKALKWITGMVFTAGSFFFTIKAFTNFDQLSPTEKATLILDATSGALAAFNKGGPALLNKFKDCFSKGHGSYDFATMLTEAKQEEAVLLKLTRMTETGASAVVGEDLTIEQAIGKTMQSAGGDLGVVESRWSKAFKMAGKVAKITGILASFIGAVTIGLQIFRDIKNGENPAVISFEILEGASFAMVAVCETLALVIECQAIPIVGQVCAIIGLVASIILLFVHRNPPDTRTPSEIYCDERGGPYIDSNFAIPSEEWLNEYHEEHPDEPEMGPEEGTETQPVTRKRRKKMTTRSKKKKGN